MNLEKDIKVLLPIRITIGKRRLRRFYLNLNQYRNWNTFVSNDIKKAFQENVSKRLDFKFNSEVEVDYTYYAPDSRVRDLMNVISVVDKFFQDTMTSSGCIVSDDTKTVKKITCKYGGIDRENPRIEAVIKQYNED
jgi:hypothetical protein